MILHLSFLIALIGVSYTLPYPATPQAQQNEANKPIFYVPEKQQIGPGIQYDLAILQPQFQVPGYNFMAEKPPFPRVQPQILLYHGGVAPGGQPFLLQPGAPPGNFLIPQGGPNIIIRDSPTLPPRPVFVAGYPKPAHIPPIEKDAEEVPTNPSKIPPLTPTGKRPEKIETFNEDDPKKTATEADVLNDADRNPTFNTRPTFQPGHRFFILNGQPLFADYPYNNNQYYPRLEPNIVDFRLSPISSNVIPSSPEKVASQFQGVYGEAHPGPVLTRLQPKYPSNLVLLNHPGSFQENVLRNAPPLHLEQSKEFRPQYREDNVEIGQLENSDENDAVVVDAGEQQDDGSYSPDDEEEEKGTDVEAPSVVAKSSEPTISQAQPSAIALAGPGGVAAAAPRGTAFVGKEGVAVSSPQATAVAGPSQEEAVEENLKKQKKRKQ